MQQHKSNLSSSTEDLYVEEFPPFLDLPPFSFDGGEAAIHQSDDLTVSFQVLGHYAVYRAVYHMLPPGHPESMNYLAYDINALEQQQRKVYKFYTKGMEEISLGVATYDIGLLFSGARVFAETHFIEGGYRL
jgi:hypothetical protein